MFLGPFHACESINFSSLTCCRFVLQIVTSASTDLQDYTYYFVPAPWLSVKLLRLLQCYPPPGNAHITALVISLMQYTGSKELLHCSVTKAWSVSTLSKGKDTEVCTPECFW